jgi:D-alanyl-D-alanine carboxypeptidase
MIFSMIMHIFLSLSGGAQRQPLTAQAQPQQAEMQEIRGFDDATATSFAHRLPLLSEFEGFGPRRKPSTSLGVVPNAESALVIDERTWTVLYEKSPNEKRSMASITKLMTAMVLHDQQFDPPAS